MDRPSQLHEHCGFVVQVESSNAGHNRFVKLAQDWEVPFGKAFHYKIAFSVLGKDRISYFDNVQMHCIPYVWMKQTVSLG